MLCIVIVSSSSAFEEFDDIDRVNVQDEGTADRLRQNLYASARAGRAGGNATRIASTLNAPAAGRARVGTRAGNNSFVIRINTCVKYVSCNSHTQENK